MKKTLRETRLSSSKHLSGDVRLRKALALSLIFGAAFILLARAANPPQATIGPNDTTPVAFVGTAPGGASSGEETCVDGVNCDVFKITATGTAADWSATLIKLSFNWTLPANDYDFYIHKDSVTGPIVGTGRNDGAPATDDNAAIDPQATGVGDYFVHIVYFSVVGVDQYQGTAAVIPRATGTRSATYTTGGIAFSPNVALKAPVAGRDGEPSIRTDYKGNSYAGGIRGVPAGVDLWYVNLDPTSTMFDPLLRFPAYRGQPDGTTEQTPADVGGDGGGDIDLAVGFPPLAGETEPAVPFLAYSSLTLANISTGNTTDRGVSFNLNPLGNLTGGPPGDDRQWHEFLGANSVYILYRTVAPAIAQVQRSNNGGFLYGPTAAVGLIGQVGCLDVHQATGTVYAAGNNGVIAVGTPSIPGQAPLTADYIIRTAATDPAGVAHIFFVAKVADDGTPNGTLYALYSNDRDIFLKHSTDKGGTWSAPVRVNPPSGPLATNVNVFPWMETGPTPGSVAIVWFGTTNSLNNDDAQWKVYFAQSFNANGTTPAFQIAEVTEPAHFIHGSNISEGGLDPTGGANRNLIDYFQVSFDPLGAAVIAYTDDHNDFDGHTYLARQISGPSIRGGNLPAVVPGANLAPPPPTPRVPASDVSPPAQAGPNGEQVTDYLLDVQTALAVRVPTADPLDISSVKYETLGSAPAQSIKATIAVTDLSAIPPSSFWRASFAANAPNSVLSPTGTYSFGLVDDADQFYVEAKTDAAGAQTFVYGTAVRNPDGTITYTQVGPADSGLFDSANNKISIQVSLTKLNAVLSANSHPLLATGSIVAGLRGRSATTDPGSGTQTRRDLTRGGTQFIIGGSSIVPLSAVSRKIHGPAGVFDINLPLAGAPGVECRTSQSGGQYQVVITFANPVVVTNGSSLDAPNGGFISGITVNGNVVTVDLSGVNNAQIITINLNVTDGTNSGPIAIPMGVLIGDTSGNGSVNSTDVGETKANSGQTANAGNFRTDVTVNGTINSSDVSIVKTNSGTNLPGPVAAERKAR
ncbi:MAG: dockerin type I domain-containing protein [Chthoniobacterales bacterium]